MKTVLGLVENLLMLNIALAFGVIFIRARSNFRAWRFWWIEDRWEAVIIKVIGGDAVVPPVPANDARHVLEIAGRFARRLRGPDRMRVEEFSAPFVGLLLPDLTARSAEKRAAAVELLSVLALDAFADDIVVALDDRSPRVSLVAAKALSSPDRPECTAEVLDRLHRYSNWNSSLIALMLARVGVGALDDLRDYLGDVARPAAARAVVAAALTHLSDPVSASLAADTLESADPELVVACLRLIYVVGGPAQADAVRDLVDHPVFFVRAATAAALGRIGDESDVPAITELVHDDSPWVVLRSTGALLALGGNDALQELAAGQGLAADSARETLFGELVR
jgi:hypothetical protein